MAGERDHRDDRITELVEAIAHGDHVFLAGQSSQMAVEHQHDRPPPEVGGAPRLALVVDERDVGQTITELQRHGVTFWSSASEPTSAGDPVTSGFWGWERAETANSQTQKPT